MKKSINNFSIRIFQIPPIQFLFLLFLTATISTEVRAQFHAIPTCNQVYDFTWDSTPTNADEFNWPSAGALTGTFNNVDGSGVNFTFTFSGETNTLGDWNMAGGANTPLVGTDAADGLKDVLQFFTDGFASTGVTLTVTFSQPLYEVGFDMSHINGAGPNGDGFIITATNTLGGTVYPSFSDSPNPSYSNNSNTGNLDSNNNSTDGTNDEVGINFSDDHKINSITFLWDDCSACTLGAIHGSALGNFRFCKDFIDTDNDGISDKKDFDDDNDGITDVQELCGADPQNLSTTTATISINLDGWPGETSWELNSPSGLVANGGPYTTAGLENTTVTRTVTVNEAGNYTFTIFDSYGDGLLGNTYTISGADFSTITTPFNDQGVTNTPVSQSENFTITSAANSNFSCLAADPNIDSDEDGILNYKDADYCTLNGAGVCTSMDTDGDGILNSMDIDADNDGIVDNTEAQASDNYIAPANADNDGDGLDNAYDPDFATNVYLIPTNTDMTANPDFLDTDADNDGVLDAIEGHDIDGNGTADAGSPAGNGGTGSCAADADGDGLLDCYDNNSGSKDPTNGNLQPTSHPDAVDAGATQDWRQGKCTLCATLYAIQDGNGTQTTTYKYNNATGKMVSNSNTYGTIRTNSYCASGGWRYYYNPAEPTAALFALRGDAADLDNLDYIEITVGQNPNDRQAGSNNVAYTRLMNRDWFVKMKEPQVNPIDVRFYYPGTDYATNGYIAANTTADTYGLTDAPTFVWFKVSNWDTYAPSLIEANGSSIANAIGYTSLIPSTNADLSTGLCQADGTAGVDIGNGKNYVQFDGLTSFSGGTAGFGAGDSQLPQGLLPVVLSSLTTKLTDCRININWSAESEINFSHYDLEKSTDGQRFNKLSTIAASNGYASKEYQYTDQNILPKNYYRLKQVDLDGSFEYSSIRFVAGEDCTNQDQAMQVFPNPVPTNSEVAIRFEAIEGPIQFKVYSAMGQLVKVIDHIAFNGTNKISFSVQKFPKGIYHLVNSTNGQTSLFVVE